MRGADRSHLSTERENERSADLDRLPTAEALDVLFAEDAHAVAAVAAARDEIAHAVELVAERLAAGGRLVYVGAGTSGRLGVLDAVECPPTFHSAPGQVQAVLAGGEAALAGAVEGAEDSSDDARRALAEREVGPRDVVFGISAGGTTPFVHAALDEARRRGAATVFLACVPREEHPDAADVSIRAVTGPEVVTGSTRLKAGTATKLVLNAVSTLAMVRLGKVHGNRMVDLRPTNAKLVDRALRLVAELAGVDRARAEELLQGAGGRVKVAVLAERLAGDVGAAERALERAGGHLGSALEALSGRRDRPS